MFQRWEGADFLVQARHLDGTVISTSRIQDLMGRLITEAPELKSWAPDRLAAFKTYVERRIVSDAAEMVALDLGLPFESLTTTSYAY
jgi:hypothetical protein